MGYWCMKPILDFLFKLAVIYLVLKHLNLL